MLLSRTCRCREKKTLLLDGLRKSNVQKGEVGRITQQIGSTFFNYDALTQITGSLSKSLEIPGLLIIDTPGHDCFTQMRLVGIRVSNLPILVVDALKGLEEQSIHCINLLNKHGRQFIIALNKVDRVPGWVKTESKNLKGAFAKQSRDTLLSLKDCSNRVLCQLAKLGIDGALYYENSDPKNKISIVPVSAKTGEGIADLIILISKLTIKKLNENQLYRYCSAYILEAKQDEKHGLIAHALLLSNLLKKGDKVLIEVLNGPPVLAQIKEILVPPDQKELKNKVSFKTASSISGTSGIAIKFTDDSIYSDIAPGGLFIKYDSEGDIGTIRTIMDRETCRELEYDKFEYDETGIIINVPARGMADAIIKLLRGGSTTAKIQDVNIGKVNKSTIIRAGKHLSSCKDSVDYTYNKRYAVILDYNDLYREDVEYDGEVVDLQKKMDVKIISANVIHHLIDKYNKFAASIDNSIKKMYANVSSNFKLQILPKYIFLKKSPLMFGVKVLSGNLLINASVCAKSAKEDEPAIKLGSITSMQKKNKPVDSAAKNDEICIRIESDGEKYEYGKNFNEEWILEPYLNDYEQKLRDKYSFF
jgi:translation initiation factor 5B